MILDEKNLYLAGAWASIGQFIIAALILFLDIRRDLMSEQKPNPPGRNLNYVRFIVAYLSLFIFLAASAFAVYWVTILISTSSKGTLSELVTRAAAWATFLGLGSGVFIGQWLPKRITNLVREKVGEFNNG